MRIRLWGLVVLTIAVACADPISVPQGDPLEPFEGSVSLLSPSPGALFVQNDASIGCSSHPFRGYGFRFDFDWEDVSGADRYAIHLKKVGALYPAIDQNVLESAYDAAWCNAFVIDANLNNWVWRVAAIDLRPGGAAPDTLWSEERAYGFAPCRHSGDVPCTAPPEP
jgi:hypothetical protein